MALTSLWDVKEMEPRNDDKFTEYVGVNFLKTICILLSG